MSNLISIDFVRRKRKAQLTVGVKPASMSKIKAALARIDKLLKDRKQDG